MRSIKHEPFCYNDATAIANTVIQCFYDGRDSFDDFFESNLNDIAHKLIKPEKQSLLHLYIDWIKSQFDEIQSILDNVDVVEFQSIFDFMESTLNQLGERSNTKLYPNYPAIQKCYHCTECRSCLKFQRYIDWLKVKITEYTPQIIHSTFHILMINKTFLRDFHEGIAKAIEYDKVKLHTLYPENIDANGIIKRTSWPVWLKRGIFFRDKGVCTLCRNPLSGDLFLGIDPDMDHIVPLALHGSNDSSNIQILCNVCNNKKRHYSSATSSFDIPMWNLT
ncbi:HNH endonuclease [Paenibacillus terrigena]|uniref:HNH endonuclease n=1 Tax=Paenibacillus terrigena TaxID=369333 RepID=UPI0028D08A65|nr:HNH endonuclease [Paenibacillus terrigena]